MTQKPTIHVIVDGESLNYARTRANLRMDYEAIAVWAEDNPFGAREVAAVWVGSERPALSGLYRHLRRQNWTVSTVPYVAAEDGWRHPKEQVLKELQGALKKDGDILFVGVDSYEGRFVEILREAGSSRLFRRRQQVAIISVQGLGEFSSNEFRVFDLVEDVGAATKQNADEPDPLTVPRRDVQVAPPPSRAAATQRGEDPDQVALTVEALRVHVLQVARDVAIAFGGQVDLDESGLGQQVLLTRHFTRETIPYRQAVRISLDEKFSPKVENIGSEIRDHE